MYFDDLQFLPPHTATPIAGFHAYTRQLGVSPGAAVELCLSNDGPVDVAVLRYLGPKITDGQEIDRLPSVSAAPQAIHRGSYVYVERGVGDLDALSVEIWCRPLAHLAPTGLMQQHGFRLMLDDAGRPVFTIEGAETSFRIAGPVVSLQTWHHLVGCFGAGQLALFLDGELVGRLDVTLGRINGGGPLRIGALANELGEACAFFTGDIWVPTLYADVFSPEQVAERFSAIADEPAPHCIGCWRFGALKGTPYRDISPARRHGQPVNYPIRMIPGPRRTDDSDWSTYDPTSDPDFGNAVRLMGDAIVDCRWPVAATWTVPESAPSGQYGFRFTNERGESRYVHFIVRPSKPTARLICLSTTNTRVAYNFQSFADPKLDYGAYKNHPHFPFLGHLLGARRPATGELWETTTIHFELPFYAWLEERGIPYDLYTEWDLERDPSLLDRYDAAAWAGHSEYWTPTQYESLQRFAQRGGHLISLSGNTAYWRVSVDLENQVVEVRKHCRTPTPGTTCNPMLNAAHWHQMDHLPGTTMREAGWPEWNLLGGATNGWTLPPLDGPRAGYEVLAPDHWAFRDPRPVATGFPFAPDAAGYETDLSIRSMFERFGRGKMTRYPARNAGSAEPEDGFDEGLVVLARAKLSPSLVIDYDNTNFDGEMWSEMLIWERPGQGIIFHSGSVLASHILSQDENFANLLLNVMDRMGLAT